MILLGHLSLLVPFSGATSVPVAASFLLLCTALIASGFLGVATALERPWIVGYEREAGALIRVTFGVGAAPLALLQLLEPGNAIVDGAFWATIAARTPAVAVRSLEGQ